MYDVREDGVQVGMAADGVWTPGGKAVAGVVVAHDIGAQTGGEGAAVR